MATKQISLSTESIPISKRTSAAALARRKAIADELLKQSMTPMGRGVIDWETRPSVDGEEVC